MFHALRSPTMGSDGFTTTLDPLLFGFTNPNSEFYLANSYTS